MRIVLLVIWAISLLIIIGCGIAIIPLQPSSDEYLRCLGMLIPTFKLFMTISLLEACFEVIEDVFGKNL